MDEKEKSSINTTTVWRIIVGVIIAVFSFFGSWGFTQITTMPEKYATKTELQCSIDRVDAQLRSINTNVGAINNHLINMNMGRQ